MLHNFTSQLLWWRQPISTHEQGRKRETLFSRTTIPVRHDTFHQSSRLHANRRDGQGVRQHKINVGRPVSWLDIHPDPDSTLHFRNR